MRMRVRRCPMCWVSGGCSLPVVSSHMEVRQMEHHTRRWQHTGRALAITGAMLLSAVAPVSAQSPSPTSGGSGEAGMCVGLQASAVPPGAWGDIVGAIGGAARARPLIFPDAAIETIPTLDGSGGTDTTSDVQIGIWDTGGSDPAGAAQRLQTLASGTCLGTSDAWTATISRDLLLAGSLRILETAPLDPDVRASIELEVELHPADDMVRTVLRFAVAGGFSHGICWVDDGLTIDTSTGRALSSDQVFADLQFGIPGNACERFRAFMPEGGAGGQAIALQPVEITLADGSTVRFVATSVDVQDADIVLAGHIERG